jgi:hypothetical protein
MMNVRGKKMKIRVIITIVVVGIIAVAAGYRLAQAGLEASAAEPAPVAAKASPSSQATTIEEVQLRAAQPAALQPATFADDLFSYHLVYPLGWEADRIAGNQVVFRSPDGSASVTVEAVGPLAEKLTTFANRSLGDNIVISRQSLTVHGLPAERVIAYSDEAGSQVTLFFIDAGSSAYVLTGVGEQQAVEMIARSFNSPELVVQG